MFYLLILITKVNFMCGSKHTCAIVKHFQGGGQCLSSSLTLFETLSLPFVIAHCYVY